MGNMSDALRRIPVVPCALAGSGPNALQLRLGEGLPGSRGFGLI